MLRRALPLALCACALLALQLPAAAAGRKGGDGGGDGDGGGGEGGGPVVTVQQGRLQGRRVDQSDSPVRTYYAFEGIPYARPPVGELRFQDPLEPQPWRGLWNATANRGRCIQKFLDTFEIVGEEDCLFLNVYNNAPPKSWPTARRPVMLFLHGGAFIMGSGNLGTVRVDSILRGEVVFVIINYRLGIMGFLNTEDSAAPGNAALKDMVMALRWVKQNIAAFGGDPNNVTVAGTSAGAGAVQFLVESPLAAGLFHRALAMSGSVLGPWALIDHPRRYAVAVRQRFNASCPDAAPEDIVPCLQRVAARDIVDSEDQVPPPEFAFRFWKHTFLPAVEAPGSSPAPFLPADPEELLRRGRFPKVPFMTGVVSCEGCIDLFYSRLNNESSSWRSLEENFVETLLVEMPRGLRTREAVLRMRQFYFGNRTLVDGLTNADTRNRYVNMISDLRINVGVVGGARILAGRGLPVFLYEFTHEGAFAFERPLWNLTVGGVAHGDDLPYFFDFPAPGSSVPPQGPPEEVAVRERQAALYTTFARTGNPTPEGSEYTHWPRYTAKEERYMDMGANLTVRDHIFRERMAFWRQLFDTPEAREGYSSSATKG